MQVLLKWQYQSYFDNSYIFMQEAPEIHSRLLSKECTSRFVERKIHWNDKTRSGLFHPFSTGKPKQHEFHLHQYKPAKTTTKGVFLGMGVRLGRYLISVHVLVSLLNSFPRNKELLDWPSALNHGEKRPSEFFQGMIKPNRICTFWNFISFTIKELSFSHSCDKQDL